MFTPIPHAPSPSSQLDRYITVEWLASEWESCTHEYQKAVHVYGALPTIPQLLSSHQRLADRIRTFWGSHELFRIAHDLPGFLPANTPFRPPRLEITASPSPTQEDTNAVVRLRQALRHYYRWITTTQGRELNATELLKVAPQTLHAQIRTLWGSWDSFRAECKTLTFTDVSIDHDTMPDILTPGIHAAANQPHLPNPLRDPFAKLPSNPFTRKHNNPILNPTRKNLSMCVPTAKSFIDFCTHGIDHAPTPEEIETLHKAGLLLGKGTRGSAQYIPVHRMIRLITTSPHMATAISQLFAQWIDVPSSHYESTWITKFLRSAPSLMAWPFLPQSLRDEAAQLMRHDSWHYADYHLHDPVDSKHPYHSYGLKSVASLRGLAPDQWTIQLRALLADDHSTRVDLAIALSRMQGEWKHAWDRAPIIDDPRQLHMPECSEGTLNAITTRLADPALPSYWLQERLHDGFVLSHLSLVRHANSHLTGDELVNVWKQFAWLQQDQVLSLTLPWPTDITSLLDPDVFRTPHQDEWATRLLEWVNTGNPEPIAPHQIESRGRKGESAYLRPPTDARAHTYGTLHRDELRQREYEPPPEERRYRQKTGRSNESVLRAWCQFFDFEDHTAIGEELQAQFPHALNLFLHSIKHPGTRHARAGQMRKWKMRYEELNQNDES